MTNDFNTNNNEEIILLAFQKQIKLHIVLTSGIWKNGFVVQEPNADFFLFKDMVRGEEPIFFLQLKKVEPYTEEVKA